MTPATERNRQYVLNRIKKRGRKHYAASQANRDMNCGGALGDFLRGNDTEGHMLAYHRCVARLRRVDPCFPKSANGGAR